MINKKFLKILAIISLFSFVVFIQQFPNFYAYQQTKDTTVFFGQASWFDPWDIGVYVAAITCGQQECNLLLKNLYTTETMQPSFVYPIYTLIGNLIPNISGYTLFHFLAGIVSIILVIIIYLLMNKYLKSFWLSFTGTAITVLGGGFGGLTGGILPGADLTITAFTFQSALQRAHEGIGLILYLTQMMLSFMFFQTDNNTLKNKFLIGIITTGLLLIPIYPYYILSNFAIISIYYLLMKNNIKFKDLVKWMISVGLTTFFTIIYFFHLQSTGFSALVNQTLSNVSLFNMMLGFGLFIISFVAIYFIQKPLKWSKLTIYLSIWIVTSIILSYLPIGISRFYLRGLFFPLTLGLMIGIKQISIKAYQTLIIILIVSSFLISGIYPRIRRLEAVSDNNSWFYQPKSVSEGFDYLSTIKTEGILSGYIIGNYLPARIGKTAYFGHFIQTPEGKEKYKLISNFYAGKFSEEEAQIFLEKNKISHIVYSQEEIELGGHIYQSTKICFNKEKMKIYCVIK